MILVAVMPTSKTNRFMKGSKPFVEHFVVPLLKAGDIQTCVNMVQQWYQSCNKGGLYWPTEYDLPGELYKQLILLFVFLHISHMVHTLCLARKKLLMMKKTYNVLKLYATPNSDQCSAPECGCITEERKALLHHGDHGAAR